jgi:DNA repair protein RecO (recombination protein O)
VLYKDEAVALRTMRLGEADRIVTFLGRNSGKIRAVAKGVRKTKSRFGGRMEPFTQVSLVLWRGRSGGLDTVTQVDVVQPFREIRENLPSFARGQVMLEAVDRVVQERERSARIFILLTDSLHGLAAAERQGISNELVLASFLLRLSGLAGFAPSLLRCAECGGAPDWFSPGQGGAVCNRCRDDDAEEVSRRLLQLMHDAVRDGAWMDVDQSLAESGERLARYYAEYHLERRLRAASAAEIILAR